MTIYRLYAQNGNSAGFWVQHRQWANACAHVHSVNGRRIGALSHDADARDDAAVVMQSFDVRSGRPLEPVPLPADDRHFDQIAEPSWYRFRRDDPPRVHAAAAKTTNVPQYWFLGV
jgi:hypothetical protein